MKQIEIYATGSCDTESRTGHGHAILRYNGADQKHIAVAFENTSANRCILHAIIAALQAIKKPCTVVVVTATSLGASKPNKSANSDLLTLIFAEAKQRGCTLEFELMRGGGPELQAKVRSFHKNHPRKFMPIPTPKWDAVVLDRYTQSIEFEF